MSSHTHTAFRFFRVPLLRPISDGLLDCTHATVVFSQGFDNNTEHQRPDWSLSFVGLPGAFAFYVDCLARSFDNGLSRATFAHNGKQLRKHFGQLLADSCAPLTLDQLAAFNATGYSWPVEFFDLRDINGARIIPCYRMLYREYDSLRVATRFDSLQSISLMAHESIAIQDALHCQAPNVNPVFRAIPGIVSFLRG